QPGEYLRIRGGAARRARHLLLGQPHLRLRDATRGELHGARRVRRDRGPGQRRRRAGVADARARSRREGRHRRPHRTGQFAGAGRGADERGAHELRVDRGPRHRLLSRGGLAREAVMTKLDPYWLMRRELLSPAFLALAPDVLRPQRPRLAAALEVAYGWT